MRYAEDCNIVRSISFFVLSW